MIWVSREVYIYDKDHMSELQIRNRSERDLRSCEVTNKAQKKFWGSNRIQTHDLCDTSVMLYQLRYEASPDVTSQLQRSLSLLCFEFPLRLHPNVQLSMSWNLSHELSSWEVWHLERLSRTSLLEQPGIWASEWLWFKCQSLQEPIQMHKLL